MNIFDTIINISKKKNGTRNTNKKFGTKTTEKPETKQKTKKNGTKIIVAILLLLLLLYYYYCILLSNISFQHTPFSIDCGLDILAISFCSNALQSRSFFNTLSHPR